MPRLDTVVRDLLRADPDDAFNACTIHTSPMRLTRWFLVSGSSSSESGGSEEDASETVPNSFGCDLCVSDPVINPSGEGIRLRRYVYNNVVEMETLQRLPLPSGVSLRTYTCNNRPVAHVHPKPDHPIAFIGGLTCHAVACNHRVVTVRQFCSIACLFDTIPDFPDTNENRSVGALSPSVSPARSQTAKKLTRELYKLGVHYTNAKIRAAMYCPRRKSRIVFRSPDM